MQIDVFSLYLIMFSQYTVVHYFCVLEIPKIKDNLCVIHNHIFTAYNPLLLQGYWTGCV